MRNTPSLSSGRSIKSVQPDPFQDEGPHRGPLFCYVQGCQQAFPAPLALGLGLGIQPGKGLSFFPILPFGLCQHNARAVVNSVLLDRKSTRLNSSHL